jgi:hypothetical protein
MWIGIWNRHLVQNSRDRLEDSWFDPIWPSCAFALAVDLLVLVRLVACLDLPSTHTTTTPLALLSVAFRSSRLSAARPVSRQHRREPDWNRFNVKHDKVDPARRRRPYASRHPSLILPHTR